MTVWLKNINESLEKRYSLTESKTLNEAFGDNVPKWFKDRVLTTKYLWYRGEHKTVHWSKMRDTFGLHNVDDPLEKNPQVGGNVKYANVRGDDKYSDQSLFQKLLDANINLDKLTVIEGEIPTKGSDPRLKEPNLPVFLFDDGQVYVKGINDSEIYHATGKQLGHLPMKRLLDECIKFAYIDGNDDNNFMPANKKPDREANRSDMISRQRAGVERLSDVERQWDGNYYGKDETKNHLQTDKSGYVAKKLEDRYREKLRGTFQKKCVAKLDDIAERLTNCYRILVDELNNFSPMDKDELRMIDRCRDNLYTIKSGIEQYNYHKDNLENYTKEFADSDEDWFDNLCKNVLSSIKGVENNYVKPVEEFIDNNLSGEIDWI